MIMEQDTEDNIKKTIRLIKSYGQMRNYTIAFSGGKDSCVIDYLCKEAGCNFKLVYNNTTIDPRGTIAFVKKKGAIVQQPKHTFFDLVEKKGLPTMFRRFCCKELKEQYVSPFLITGVRKSESVKRNQRYCSFEDSYAYSKKLITTRFHPIIHFTDADIEYIINSRQIECHPLYYDENGKFNVNKRLGCIACPLQGDRGFRELKDNPKFLKQLLKRCIIFHKNHGRTETDAYLNFIYNIFYSNHGLKKFQQTFNGLFEYDPKEFIETKFNIQL